MEFLLLDASYFLVLLRDTFALFVIIDTSIFNARPSLIHACLDDLKMMKMSCLFSDETFIIGGSTV